MLGELDKAGKMAQPVIEKLDKAINVQEVQYATIALKQAAENARDIAGLILKLLQKFEAQMEK